MASGANPCLQSATRFHNDLSRFGDVESTREVTGLEFRKGSSMSGPIKQKGSEADSARGLKDVEQRRPLTVGRCTYTIRTRAGP